MRTRARSTVERITGRDARPILLRARLRDEIETDLTRLAQETAA